MIGPYALPLSHSAIVVGKLCLVQSSLDLLQIQFTSFLRVLVGWGRSNKSILSTGTIENVLLQLSLTLRLHPKKKNKRTKFGIFQCKYIFIDKRRITTFSMTLYFNANIPFQIYFQGGSHHLNVPNFAELFLRDFHGLRYFETNLSLYGALHQRWQPCSLCWYACWVSDSMGKKRKLNSDLLRLFNLQNPTETIQ